MCPTERQNLLLNRNKEIASLYRAGKTLDGAGAPFGLKKEMVRRILLKQGIAGRRLWSKAALKPTAEEKRKAKQLRFWSQVAITADSNRCWEWQGYVNPSGYGRTCWLGKRLYAHHLSWEIHYSKAPEGYLLNNCGNKKCVNTAHYRESADKRRKMSGGGFDC